MDISSSANGWYQVRSCTERNKFYEVNVSIGVCTCERGQDGSPCVHQAAVVLNFGIESLNYIATLSANARLKIATIALGDGAVKQLSFYSSLHQSVLEEKYTSVHTSVNDSQEMCSNFEGSAWDLMRSEGDHFVSVSEEKEENISISKLGDEIDDFAKQLKLLLNEDDHQLLNGVVKFLRRFKSLSSYRSTAQLASALHRFGWVFGGTISRTNSNGQVHHGKRIPVQAKSAGRRRGKSSYGKCKVPSGRPSKVSGRHSMPTRKEPKGKRAHSLLKGVQNAGKW